MLVIRMQRTGRKGHAMFRVVVQDSRLTPTSGKVVAQLGHYDPHSKSITLDKEKASFYIGNGAQPSDRTVRLLQAEGVKLPAWVKLPAAKQSTVRNPDKRRSTAPAQEEPEAPEVMSEAATEAVTEAAPEAADSAPEADSGAPAENVVADSSAPEQTEATSEEANPTDEKA
jgi:small subunit ribosomal protein S16